MRRINIHKFFLSAISDTITDRKRPVLEVDYTNHQSLYENRMYDKLEQRGTTINTLNEPSLLEMVERANLL